MDSVSDPTPREGSRYALRSRARHADLQRHMLAFGRELRRREMLVTSSEVVDSLRAVDSVDVADRRDVYLALRSIMVCRLDDVPVFDEVFDQFWRRIARAEDLDQQSDELPSDSQPQAPHCSAGKTKADQGGVARAFRRIRARHCKMRVRIWGRMRRRLRWARRS